MPLLDSRHSVPSPAAARGPCFHSSMIDMPVFFTGLGGKGLIVAYLSLAHCH